MNAAEPLLLFFGMIMWCGLLLGLNAHGRSAKAAARILLCLGFAGLIVTAIIYIYSAGG